MDTAASPQACALWGRARSTAIQTVCSENFSGARTLRNPSSMLLGTGKDLRAQIEKAVDAGVKRENDFRGVKAGDLAAGGTPAHVRYTIE